MDIVDREDEQSKKIDKKYSAAVAIKSFDEKSKNWNAPKVTAAGFGSIADQIVALAFQNGIKVREDANLAQMLAKLELESDIPSEALIAVAEILSYVYKVNGHLPQTKKLNKKSDDES